MAGFSPEASHHILPNIREYPIRGILSFR
jgi:hypothetical protein